MTDRIDELKELLQKRNQAELDLHYFQEIKEKLVQGDFDLPYIELTFEDKNYKKEEEKPRATYGFPFPSIFGYPFMSDEYTQSSPDKKIMSIGSLPIDTEFAIKIIELYEDHVRSILEEQDFKIYEWYAKQKSVSPMRVASQNPLYDEDNSQYVPMSGKAIETFQRNTANGLFEFFLDAGKPVEKPHLIVPDFDEINKILGNKREVRIERMKIDETTRQLIEKYFKNKKGRGNV